MAYGGGNFYSQNKKLPGFYVNFKSAPRWNAALSDRGVVAMPMVMDWGASGVVEVTVSDFVTNGMSIFGYNYSNGKMKGIRDLFRNAQKVYFYRLNTGTAATSTYADAKYGGTRGNDIKIVIDADVSGNTYTVQTYIAETAGGSDYVKVDEQTGIATMSALADNAFVVWKDAASIGETAGTKLTGGANGSEVTSSEWMTALAALETYVFHVFACVTTDATINALVDAWTKRMRDENGVKFQTVFYSYLSPNYEGAISVKNTITGADATTFGAAAMVYWVAGARAACAVNGSLLNAEYDGEFTVDLNYTQTQLENAIDEGSFIFHRVGDVARVLDDINTLVSFTADKTDDFRINQVVVVLDQFHNDARTLWESIYLGKVQNNEAGRSLYWKDLVKLCDNLQELGAIENFASENITVAAGTGKRDVVVAVALDPVAAMRTCYLTCTVY